MQGIRETDQVFSEIDDLYHFVSYGSERVNNFIKQVNRLESSYVSLSNKANVDQFMRQCHSVDGYIQATGDSIKDWKTKAGSYLVFIHEVAKEPQVKGLGEAEQKIHSLITMLKQQNSHILYLQEKLQAIHSMVLKKRIALQRKIRRGREPQLVGTEANALA